MQIHDGRILADSNGIGAALQASVQAYLKNRPAKSAAEIQASVDWCVKMLERVKRGDCEGMFRWHWVLTDSLEIFCDILRQPYWGPKKTLKWMETTHPESFTCYKRALENLHIDHLEEWVAHLKALKH